MKDVLTNVNIDNLLAAKAAAEEDNLPEATSDLGRVPENLSVNTGEPFPDELVETPCAESTGADIPAEARKRGGLTMHRDKTAAWSLNQEVLSTPEGEEAFVDPWSWVEPYTPFPVGVLPEVIQNYVLEASVAIGCDSSLIALPLLASVARAISNRRVIELKETWTEPAIIWAVIVSPSGTHKSPALKAGTSFITSLEEKSHKSFGIAQAEYQKDLLNYERKLASWRKKREDSKKKLPQLPKAPVCLRYMTTDTTMEALTALQSNQFDSILIVRDELSGWLGSIAEYKGGVGGDLGHWLSFWSAAPLTVDRKTGDRRLMHIPRASVSIVGGIQPDVLARAMGDEHMEDGLCARLLLAMPDPKPVQWTDDTISPECSAAVSDVFDRLLALEAADDESTGPSPVAIPLSSGAKTEWIKYYNHHHAEMEVLDVDLKAAWSKLEAYTARFALIFQLVDCASGEQRASADEIDESAMLSAIKLSEWFGNEARRVYRLFSEEERDREDRELFQLVTRMGGRVTVRDLMRNSRRFANADTTEKALHRLVARKCGEWEAKKPTAKGGRPSQTFQLYGVETADTTSADPEAEAVLSVAT